MHEKDKTRITLYKHVETILDLFSSYNSSADFWMIEKTVDEGLYFATKYNKLSSGKIEKARFMMTLSTTFCGTSRKASSGSTG